MIDLQVLKENPELAKSVRFEIVGSELLKYTDQEASRLAEARIKDQLIPQEEYLKPQEFAEVLKISMVTLWNWDNKGITRPLRIGNKKRYRRSDLEKILQER